MCLQLLCREVLYACYRESDSRFVYRGGTRIGYHKAHPTTADFIFRGLTSWASRKYANITVWFLRALFHEFFIDILRLDFLCKMIIRKVTVMEQLEMVWPGGQCVEDGLGVAHIKI